MPLKVSKRVSLKRKNTPEEDLQYAREEAVVPLARLLSEADAVYWLGGDRSEYIRRAQEIVKGIVAKGRTEIRETSWVMKMEFEREELQKIADRARTAIKVRGISAHWKRAYEELEYSANVLDAFLARSEVRR